MRRASIPALLSLRAGAALFLLGAAAAAAQLSGQAPDGANESIALTLPSPPVPAIRSIAPVAPVASSNIARYENNEFPSALPVFQRPLEENQTKGNREGEAEELAAMASVYRTLRQDQKAADLFQSAIAIWHKLGNREYEATALAHVGDVYREWGFPDTALNFYQKALGVYVAASDQDGEAATLNNSGVARLTLGNRKKCLESFEMAMASYQANHDRPGEARAFSNLGAAYLYSFQDPEKALDAFQEAVAKMEILGDRAGEANALDMMGFALLKVHKEKMANSTFERARDLYQALGDAQGEARVSRHISRIATEDGSGTRRMSVMAAATPEPLFLTAAWLRVEEVAR